MGGVSGKAVRRAEHPPRKALLMPRAGAGLQSFGWRNFAHQAELVGALRSELRGWGGAVRVVPTPGGEVPFCEQLRLRVRARARARARVRVRVRVSLTLTLTLNRYPSASSSGCGRAQI